MTVWLTSDQHHGHINICGPHLSNWESGYRNFESLSEMTDTIINNINAVVKPDDVLYDLGDFAMGSRKAIPYLRDRINCKNYHLIRGNHDAQLVRRYRHCFTSIRDYCEIRYKGYFFVLSHYPLAVWNRIEHGAIQLHGHSHGSYTGVGRQMDVGVDCWNFQPISIDEVIERLKDVKPQFSDHHRPS